ncbi:DUF6660 family protein [Chitinophaga vietnamensis]|uniref:DUF6660 family protein n=1 Tax=Chitinophaga vietnamensis TaxID=2593957 RepID=UPI00117777CF|nr:DUF6660 family protein [Chitinophaga vietnamensis]
MKWFVYILSLYIVLLSCIPCNDADAAVSRSRSRIEQVSSHTDHQQQLDFCSPLCVCSCCNVQVTPASATLFLAICQQVISISCDLPVYALPCTATDVWQPPQLV